MLLDIGYRPELAPSLAPPLSCRVIADLEEAQGLRPAWQNLVDRAERRELTQSPDWLLTWWSVFGNLQGRQMRLAFFYDGARLVGAAPLLRRCHWYRGYLPFRRLEFLASGEPEEHGIYSNHLGVVAEPGAEKRVARDLANALHRGLLGAWDELVFPMMAGDALMPELLRDAFAGLGFFADLSVQAQAPFAPLPERWSDYLAGLAKPKRRSIVRALDGFDAWAQNTARLHCFATAEELPNGLKILMQLHHQRWAQDGQAGVFRSPLYLAFHERILPILARHSAVEILVLEAHGSPIAASYNFIAHGKICVYQSGRRTDLPPHMSPGRVLDAWIVRRAIEKGQREVDFLADDVPYKRLLAPQARPLVQLRISQATLRESVRRLGAMCLEGVRKIWKPRANA